MIPGAGAGDPRRLMEKLPDFQIAPGQKRPEMGRASHGVADGAGDARHGVVLI